jgi:site-specific DNA-methyltransferase (adenine-specific)
MEIINKKIDELIPYEKNPRINDDAVKYVANSIKEFGFKVPIIIDKNNVIVAGHTRLKASKELGLTEVPCIIADDLNEEQIRAFRLADNKVSEKAEWDFNLLDAELEDILDIDMNDFGFDLELEDEEETEIIEDEVPDVPEEPKARIGDIYQLGRWVICKKCGKKHYID